MRDDIRRQFTEPLTMFMLVYLFQLCRVIEEAVMRTSTVCISPANILLANGQ